MSLKSFIIIDTFRIEFRFDSLNRIGFHLLAGVRHP